MKKTGKITIHFLTWKLCPMNIFWLRFSLSIDFSSAVSYSLVIQIQIVSELPFFAVLCHRTILQNIQNPFVPFNFFSIIRLALCYHVDAMCKTKKPGASNQWASNCHCIFADRTEPVAGRRISADTVASPQHARLRHSRKWSQKSKCQSTIRSTIHSQFEFRKYTKHA